MEKWKLVLLLKTLKKNTSFFILKKSCKDKKASVEKALPKLYRNYIDASYNVPKLRDRPLTLYDKTCTTKITISLKHKVYYKSQNLQA